MSRRLRFTKMHGQGNDFVVLNGVTQSISLTPSQIRFLADRHFGVGCDQVLLVEPSTSGDIDFLYRIFNADGGEVEQCGNGARCFAVFVRQQGLTTKSAIRVSTKAGVIAPVVHADGSVTVNMGRPRFVPTDIPFVVDSTVDPTAIDYSLDVDNERYEIAALSMGNPHAVLRVESVDTAPVAALGPRIEHHPRFPARVNVGFLEVVTREHIRLRVYERGAGETLACGTGACAAVVSGIRWGLLDPSVRVSTRGGDLSVTWRADADDGCVFMSGAAVTVFEGEIELPD